MRRTNLTIQSDHDRIVDFAKIATQRFARPGREFDENAPPVVRIGAPEEDPLVDQGLEPAKCSRGGHGGGDAKARDGTRN